LLIIAELPAFGDLFGFHLMCPPSRSLKFLAYPGA